MTGVLCRNSWPTCTIQQRDWSQDNENTSIITPVLTKLHCLPVRCVSLPSSSLCVTAFQFAVCHCLPVRWRVQYKWLVLVFSALHGLAPGYIQDLVIPYSPNRNLRSINLCLFVVPRYNLEGCGWRVFSVSGQAFRKSLPENIRRSDILTRFKTVLSRIYLHWLISTEELVLYDTLTIMYFI